MKKQILFLSIMITSFLTTSCQVEQQATLNKQDSMFEIASSNLYHQYRETVANRAIMVATKSFDNDDVGKVLDKHPEKLEITDFKKSDFTHIKGGGQYYDINLKQAQLLKQLDEKYRYKSYSTDEAIKILEMYEKITEMAGEKLVKEKVIEYLSNN